MRVLAIAGLAIAEVMLLFALRHALREATAGTRIRRRPAFAWAGGSAWVQWSYALVLLAAVVAVGFVGFRLIE